MAAFKYIELSKAKVNKNHWRIIGEGRKREETTGTGGNAAVTAQGAEGKERTGWQRGPGKTSGPRREEERRMKSS